MRKVIFPRLTLITMTVHSKVGNCPILEAEAEAFAKWGPARLFTYVDPRKIASRNPGYCFKVAGWRRVGYSKDGKHLLAKELRAAQEAPK